MNKRRKTRPVRIGNVSVGGSAPVRVESMAKTNTAEVSKTIKEIERLRNAGCEIVRVAVKEEKSARALRDIKKSVRIPVVADIHFNYKLALLAIENGADSIRLNPGNIKKQSQIKEILNSAKKRKIPVRIGANSGSTPRDSMIKTVLNYIYLFERENFRDIIVSLKSSDAPRTVELNRKIARLCDYPLHIGITAAGPPESGIIKSAVGIGSLLLDGIGDTLRVSLTGDACQEVEAAKIILQVLGLRRFTPEIISCPTCGRCQVGLVGIVKKLEHELSAFSFEPSAKKFPTIAVMGCEVNGPGEAREADIGVAAGKKSGVLFRKGRIIKRIDEKDFVNEIITSLKLTD